MHFLKIKAQRLFSSARKEWIFAAQDRKNTTSILYNHHSISQKRKIIQDRQIKNILRMAKRSSVLLSTAKVLLPLFMSQYQ